MKSFLTSILFAASALGAATGIATAAAPEKITVAYFHEWPTANQVAQAEKWYDEALGVELEWRAFNTGVEMAEAMVRGEVQISYSMGVVPFALAVTAGAPIKVVGMAVDTGGADNCVIYKKEAIDRANAHELEGRKVAVPLNTVTHYKMLRSLVFLALLMRFLGQSWKASAVVAAVISVSATLAFRYGFRVSLE